MGQGLLTVLIQCACEVTGLPASVFRARVDTRFPMEVGQTTGSRATYLGGRAVVDAARKLKADLDAGKTLADLAGTVYVGEVLVDDTTKLGTRAAARQADEAPLRVQLRDAGRRPRREGPRREGRRRPRRRARDQPEALRGADRRLGPHGPRLRAHGGDGLRGRHADVVPHPRHAASCGRRTCPRSR